MQVRQLDHIQLAMPPGRENEARAFYQGLLSIPEVAKPAHLFSRGGCWFERGSLKVHLVLKRKRAGHHVWKDQPLEGYDRLYVDDPFGNRIELMEPKR